MCCLMFPLTIGCGDANEKPAAEAIAVGDGNAQPDTGEAKQTGHVQTRDSVQWRTGRSRVPTAFSWNARGR
jgi:hypothetical protein